MIEIPEKTPTGIPITDIGIWMSGGVDSTLCCYLICKTIKENNLDIFVHPLSVRRPKPGNPLHAVPISRKIKEILNFENMKPHLVYYPPIETQEEKDYADAGFFIEKNRENFNTKIQLLFSGITQNPPQEVQLGFNHGISQEEPKRGEGIKREKEACSVDGYGITHYQINPLTYLNKKDLFEIYKKEGILESLFPITRSCEQTHFDLNGKPNHPVDGHCGKCWWCEERMWAFNRLQ